MNLSLALYVLNCIVCFSCLGVFVLFMYPVDGVPWLIRTPLRPPDGNGRTDQRYPASALTVYIRQVQDSNISSGDQVFFKKMKCVQRPFPVLGAAIETEIMKLVISKKNRIDLHYFYRPVYSFDPLCKLGPFKFAPIIQLGAFMQVVLYS